MEKDGLVMDDKKEPRKRIQIQRAFSYSRLGTEFMSAAYENLVPIQQVPLSMEESPEVSREKEGRQWAM